MVAISRMRSLMLILVGLYSTLTASTPAQNTTTTTTSKNYTTTTTTTGTVDSTDTANQAVNTTSSTISTIVIMVIMVAVFYFLLIRPQRKKDKAVKNMLNSLKVGDRIVVNGISSLTDGAEIKPITEAQYQEKLKKTEKLGAAQGDLKELKKAFGK